MICSLAENVNFQLVPELNSTYATILDHLQAHIDYSSRVSLALFLMGFSLISLLLIAQFVVGIRSLTSKNFFTLKSLLLIPRSDIVAMKRQSDERYIQGNSEGDGDRVTLSDEDEDEVMLCCCASVVCCFTAS